MLLRLHSSLKGYASIARVAFFILIGFQYYIVAEFASGRFRPLVGDDPYAASLYTLHNLAKSAVFCVFCVIGWMYVFRTKAVTAGPATSYKLTALFSCRLGAAALQPVILVRRLGCHTHNSVARKIYQRILPADRICWY
jgi:hypothetical protein